MLLKELVITKKLLIGEIAIIYQYNFFTSLLKYN